jgi:hypothetical protein
MATNTQQQKAKNAPRPRPHAKKAAASAVGVEANIQRERRLLNWVYGNSEMIQRGIAREATHCGDNRMSIEMNRCLSLGAEFGKLAGIGDTSNVPAHFTRQQQHSETQSEPQVEAAIG